MADIDALVSAAAALLDLPLSQASRQGVASNLALLFERAAEFVDIPLEAETDPAALLRL